MRSGTRRSAAPPFRELTTSWPAASAQVSILGGTQKDEVALKRNFGSRRGMELARPLRRFGCGPPSGRSPAPPQAREFARWRPTYSAGRWSAGPDRPSILTAASGAPTLSLVVPPRLAAGTLAANEGGPWAGEGQSWHPTGGIGRATNVKGVSDFCCETKRGPLGRPQVHP